MYKKYKVDEILIDSRRIAGRVKEVAEEIHQEYSGKPVTFVVVLSGAFVFAADLARESAVGAVVDFVGLSSYGGGTQSGELAVTKELKTDIAGRHVIVVEDILDSGKTLAALAEMLKDKGAASVKTAVFLSKQVSRAVNFEADYVCFDVPDKFIVGYGLDAGEQFRDLPHVAVASEIQS